jgi:hypothetical protein
LIKTFPDAKFELIQEPLLGPEGDTMALLVRGTSTRTSKRKQTGNTVKWEFGSFYKVDLETERMKYGRIIVNNLDIAEQISPIPKRNGKFFRTLEKIFTK